MTPADRPAIYPYICPDGEGGLKIVQHVQGHTQEDPVSLDQAARWQLELATFIAGKIGRRPGPANPDAAPDLRQPVNATGASS